MNLDYSADELKLIAAALSHHGGNLHEHWSSRDARERNTPEYVAFMLSRAAAMKALASRTEAALAGGAGPSDGERG